jgi:DNA-binding transcriptional ArsR family regulator
MDPDRLSSEREQELRHPIRRTLLDALDGEARTLDELGSQLDLPPSRVAYHLGPLRRLGLVACVGGVYRL